MTKPARQTPITAQEADDMGHAEGSRCHCGAELGPTNRTGRCRSCSSKRACGGPPAPAEFIAIAATTKNAQLVERFAVGMGTIARWRKETGIPAPKPTGDSLRLEIPHGFALVASQLTMKEARLRYGRSADTIRRWCAEAGVTLRKLDRLVAGAATRHFSPTAPVIRRDESRAGRAADYLRRFGEVIRCDAIGHPLPDGFFWRRGGRFVLTDEELIQRAERLGWEPEAWRRIAA